MIKRLLSLVFISLLLLPGCKPKHKAPSEALLKDIHLKSGPVISCGPPDKEFGTAEFQLTCREVQADFNLAITLLHSFEYDEAEKAFVNVIDKQPHCAMAYWGVAMSNFHPLWTPPTEPELEKGEKAIQIAQTLPTSKREAGYIDAIASFYKDWKKIDHHTRCLNFEKGMEKVYSDYSNDKEAAVFYALALNAAVDPTDKTFSKQKKAGTLLNSLYRIWPNHPGIAHYLIHTYDNPELAPLGVPAAKNYASIAPSSAHALHMPSHIFTRLGLWDECIRSNLASITSAKCYAESAGIKGHWDEELHGLDYLVYAYLQKGETDSAKKQWAYLRTIDTVYPANFKVAYAFAAIPSRYLLENKMWAEAAHLTPYPADFPWKNFPWQTALFHFTRLLGFVHTHQLSAASKELNTLNTLHDTLINQKDTYKAGQVAIQMKTGEAWIRLMEGRNGEALGLMLLAADMEDKTEKHPVTPSEVVPAREMLAEMLLQMKKPKQALEAYELDLQKHPNRFNALYGAGLAAAESGNSQKATDYFDRLKRITGNTKLNFPELKRAKVVDRTSALRE